MTGPAEQSAEQSTKADRKPPEAIGGIRRLQVGCGPHNILPDWWNVDIRAFPGIDEVMDVTKPWRWSAKLEYVFGEHFLEHLDVRDGLKFLHFAGLALEVGGRIRLSTPSLEHVLSTHFILANTQRDLGQTFAINRAFHGWGHRFLYSKEMLEQCVRSAGFDDVSFHRFGESPTSALCNLERHNGDGGGARGIWIVEAARSSNPIDLPLDLMKRAEAEFGRYVDSGH
jgi:predicted SAM-dependent methyltransferase